MGTNSKIILLDSCCKAGGCSVGYHRAASDLGIEIDIVGIDIEDQPNYPYKFFKGDCLDFIRKHGKDFTHHHASFPCQEYSRTKSLHDNVYPDILEEGREELRNTGRPFVIENVLGAPMKNAIILDGPMFGLRVIRKRKFESNLLLLQPGKGYKKREHWR
jgi:DNA (cytosine-5)-methyltransferase 1